MTLHPGWGVHRHPVRGLIQCSTDNRWIGPSGNGWESGAWDDSKGTGADPTTNVFKRGFFLPPNALLKNFELSGYTTSTEVTDLTLDVVVRAPDGPTRWDVGASLIGHWVDTSLIRASLATPGFGLEPWTLPTTSLHFRRFEFDLAASTDPRVLIVSFRPTGTITVTRYLYASLAFTLWEQAVTP